MGNTKDEIYNNYYSSPNVSYCVVKCGYSKGTKIITSDPLLGTLADNGGFVQTIAVLKGSSAISSGKTGVGIPTTDARGVTRANPPTIGAYEYVLISPTYVNVISYEKDLLVGDTFALTAETDGDVEEYVLYKNGVEIARQDEGTFTVVAEAGKASYQIGVVCNGIEIKSSAVEVLAKQDLSGKDLRGQTEPTGELIFKNTIWTDGEIKGFSMESSADSFAIAKNETISAKISANATIDPDADNLFGKVSIQKDCKLVIDLQNSEAIMGFESFNQGYQFTKLNLSINGFKNNKFFLSKETTISAFSTNVNLSVEFNGKRLSNGDLTHPEYGKVWYLHTSKMAAPTPFEQWAEDNNLTGDNAKPEAKPNEDGITNLEKFVFGLPANKPTSYAENANFKQTNDGTTATFQFPLNKNVSFATKAKSATDGATVKVLVSEDLVNWSETTATQSGESGDFNLYKVEMTIPEGGKLFFKVEASQE